MDKPLKDINIDLISYNKDINYESFRKIITTRQFECFFNFKKTIFTCDKNEKQSDNENIIMLSKTDFTQLIIKLYKNYIINFCLNTRKNNNSVKYLNFKKVKKYSILIFLSSILMISFCKHAKFVIIIYYIVCMTIKNILLLFSYREIKKIKSLPKIENNMQNLPKYTILIPMYNENKDTILQSIKSINSIEYPKKLLDVKLVLEEDDIKTKKIIKNLHLPDWITQVWVPYFKPRTKPKACNVAALFATGDILVIFDSEDIPHQKQILQAAKVFNENNDIKILQACLSFYNSNKNILTECFNIEYSIWFKFTLKILDKMKITIPLGGTSNHIRYSCLEKNYWDSYNVTEDLELSVICYENNIEIKHLNSETKEWCVVNIRSFLKQRSRWIKGYLLTYFVHFLKYCGRGIDIKKIIFFHVIIGFSGLSFLLMPMLSFILITLKKNILVYIFTSLCIMYYIINTGLYFFVLKKQISSNFKKLAIFIVYPIYFLLHTLSAWIAFFEIFNKPFYWSKTKHLQKN